MTSTFVMRRATYSIAGLLCIAAAILIPIVSEAQGSGAVGGSVSDSEKAPVPGVRITIATADQRRTVSSSADGRYEFYDLPAGTYTVTADLAGFKTVEETNVVVKVGATTVVALVLQIGCYQNPPLIAINSIDGPFGWALRQSTAILHIRISKSGSGERCLITNMCVCTEHEATVTQVMKAPAGVPHTTIRFQQDGAGRFGDGSRPGTEKPYGPGQEYIAFLRWDETVGRFGRVLGPSYMFPVLNGRVESVPPDAPGLTNGMSVEDFSRALRATLTTASPSK